MIYTTVTVYFMSGTGNSYRVATWVGDAARAAGATVIISPIENAEPEREVKAGDDSLMALAFPTHGFTAPWHLLRFVARLPRRQGARALVLPTRGSVKLGRLYVPGLEGTGGYLVALLLLLKGYVLRGMMALDMPANWTALHPALGEEAVRNIIARAESKTRRLMATILPGGRFFAGQIPLLLGLLLLPLSCGYFFMGRFFLAKLFFASERCNSCGICAKQCPAGAIRMWGQPSRPYWTYACESCMRCMSVCPERAVEAGHSLAVLLYFAATAPVIDYLMVWLTRRAPALAPLNQPLFLTLLQYPYQLLAIFLAYGFFMLLTRVGLINRVFTYTTLTRYYRRYHEPGTRLSDPQLRRRL